MERTVIKQTVLMRSRVREDSALSIEKIIFCYKHFTHSRRNTIWIRMSVQVQKLMDEKSFCTLFIYLKEKGENRYEHGND